MPPAPAAVAVSAAIPFLPLLPDELEEEADEEDELELLPDPVLLPLAGASKLMRAPRLYWGVALSRSLSM